METGVAKLIGAILGEPPAVEPPVQTISRLISLLNDGQRERVIRAYFGIEESKKTLKQISKELPLKAGGSGVSQGRVSQIRTSVADKERDSKTAQTAC